MGITASEGPIREIGPIAIDGRQYHGYLARGVPEPDDGTLERRMVWKVGILIIRMA